MPVVQQVPLPSLPSTWSSYAECRLTSNLTLDVSTPTDLIAQFKAREDIVIPPTSLALLNHSKANIFTAAYAILNAVITFRGPSAGLTELQIFKAIDKAWLSPMGLSVIEQRTSLSLLPDYYLLPVEDPGLIIFIYSATLTVDTRFYRTGQYRGFAFYLTEPSVTGQFRDIYLDKTQYDTRIQEDEEVHEDDARWGDPDDRLLIYEGQQLIEEEAVKAANRPGATAGSIFESTCAFAIRWRDAALERPCLRGLDARPARSTFPFLRALSHQCS
jgi:hypothetical protein